MEHNILMHEAEDDVGVAIVDLETGVAVQAMTVGGQHVDTVRMKEDIPLGHKVAMRDLPEGKEVLEYGRPIGRAAKAITKGSHVHIHNLKSIRWG